MTTLAPPPSPPGAPAAEADLPDPTGGRQGWWRGLLTGWTDLRRSPYGVLPALIIVFVGFGQSLDSGAFTISEPTFIHRGISVQELLTVLGFVGVLVLLASLAVAYYADRHARIPVFAAGAIIGGIFRGTTGFMRTAASLGVARGVGSAFESGGATPSLSLIADYYPPSFRARAFSVLSGLSDVAGVIYLPITLGLLLLFAHHLAPVFLIYGGVVVLGGVAALVFLREPRRGYFERVESGLDEQAARREDEPPSFGEAWRTTFSVRTLRRIFIGEIFANFGRLSALFYPLLLVDIYNLGIIGRVVVSIPAAIVALVGAIIGGKATDRLIGHNPGRALTLFGVFYAVAALQIVLYATEPPLVALVILVALLGFGTAYIGPAANSVFTQIIPPNMRTLGLQITTLSALPSYLIGISVLGIIYANDGFAPVFVVCGVCYLIAGVIYASSGSFFDLDRRNALAAASAAERHRAAQLAGRAPLLACTAVNVAYDGVQVLFGVDLQVHDGEIVALLGTNGAGKSTLLRAISGTQEASGGAIAFNGRDITHMPPHEIARRGVVQMPGGKGIFPDISVRDNLLLGTWSRGNDPATRDALAEVYEMFPVLRARAGDPAGVLSGGEQQMLALALAFLMRPKLLLIDELSLGLSPAAVGSLVEAVRRINASGVAVLVVEQSVTVALELADRAVFMEKGQVRFDGPAAELTRRPDIVRAIYVTGAAAVGSSATRGFPAGRAQPGRGTPPTPAAAPVPASGAAPIRISTATAADEAPAALVVHGVSKRYGGVVALADVSLRLPVGGVLGLIGPNGSGKTTLLDVISGFVPPDAGSVTLLGEDVTELGPEGRAARGLVRRFQDARLFPSLSTSENLLIALEGTLGLGNVAATCLGSPTARRSERRVRVRADELIELLGLGGFRDKPVGELSTGLRRLVDLACVLAGEPKVLLLDEPSTGIAQSEAVGLTPLLRRVQRETGASMIVIEHDMSLLRSLADEFIALHLGSIIAAGPPAEVLADPRVVAAYLGESDATINRSGGMP